MAFSHKCLVVKILSTNPISKHSSYKKKSQTFLFNYNIFPSEKLKNYFFLIFQRKKIIFDFKFFIIKKLEKEKKNYFISLNTFKFSY
jgi:hypothetical protein